MSGVNNVLVDTNLIILGIGGNEQIKNLLIGRTLFISVITEIELLSIPFQKASEEKLIRDFISNCFIIELDGEVKRITVQLRKNNKIKLPDAIIAASSISKKLPLFTADKGFGKLKELNAVIV